MSDGGGIIVLEMVQHIVNRLVECVLVAGGYDSATAFVHDFANAAHIRGDNRQSACKRLNQHARQVLEVGEQQEEVGARIEFCDFLFCLGAVENDELLQMVVVYEPLKFRLPIIVYNV